MGNRRLQPAGDLLAPAVAETIAGLQPDGVDRGAVKLAERYAATIDAARAASADAEAAFNELDPGDVTGRQHLAKLAAKVDAQQVLADLGPKLLAALESLGATPAARARLRGGAPGAPAGRLHAIREARKRIQA